MWGESAFQLSVNVQIITAISSSYKLILTPQNCLISTSTYKWATTDDEVYKICKTDGNMHNEQNSPHWKENNRSALSIYLFEFCAQLRKLPSSCNNAATGNLISRNMNLIDRNGLLRKRCLGRSEWMAPQRSPRNGFKCRCCYRALPYDLRQRIGRSWGHGLGWCGVRPYGRSDCRRGPADLHCQGAIRKGESEHHQSRTATASLHVGTGFLFFFFQGTLYNPFIITPHATNVPQFRTGHVEIFQSHLPTAANMHEVWF